MTYPGTFHKLVVYGTLYADIFNFSINFVPAAGDGDFVQQPNQALLDAFAPILSNWWDDTTTTDGPGIILQAKLVGFKLNRIGPSGRYVDEETHEHVYTTPISGAVNSTYPPQNSVAVTLRTAVDRGLASKGRFYLPPVGSFGTLGADGRLSTTSAQDIADAAKRLLTSLNAAEAAWDDGGEGRGVAGVASDRGVGKFRIATHVSVGRVVDTMRSRRSSLAEEPIDSLPL